MKSLLAALTTAGFAQHMPLLFLLIVVPARLREAGAPLTLIGLFAFAFIPFALQFFWAPAIERMRRRRAAPRRLLGAWRDWLIVTQIAAAALLALLALAKPEIDFIALLLPGVIVLAFLAGSQKIVVGAVAVEQTTDPGQRAMATAAMGLGSALGSIAGAIGLVALLAGLGWSVTLHVAAAALLATCSLYAFVPTRFDGAPPIKEDDPPSLRRLLRTPEFWARLPQIATIGAPIGLAYGLVQPRLVDAGLDVAEVGLVNGLGQIATWLVMAPLVAFSVRRIGAQSSLRIGGWLIAVVFLALGGLTLAFGNTLWTAIASVTAAFAALIGGSTALYTEFMRRSAAGGQPATDFSVHLSLYGLTIIAAAAASGFIGDLFGYGSVLLIAACLAGWASARRD